LSRKKIAVLMDWYLPGTKAGGPVRSVYSLMSLLKSDFDFYLITTNRDLGSHECYDKIVADQWRDLDHIHYYYFSETELTGSNLLKLLNTLAPDLIYLNSFWSYYFSIGLVRAKSKGLVKPPVLLAPRGMLGKGALGLKSFKKQAYLFVAKRMGWYSAITFHATQEQEKKDILSKFPSAQIHVAPNINASAAVENKSQKLPGELKLFFLSRVDRVKNLHMALEVLQSVPANCKIEYDIFGNLENTAYWNECEALIKQLPAHITVTYKGELPFHEVQQTICRYQFLFLPTLNENFGHSIVESLLCGCPAIISDQTPWNDLEAQHAGYAIPLNEKQRFVDALIKSAALDQEQFSQKSNAAMDYIRKKIDLPAVHTHYKTLLNDCIKN
jgi:glycosyltransferase involved in cell wall biosynthesis